MLDSLVILHQVQSQRTMKESGIICSFGLSAGELLEGLEKRSLHCWTDWTDCSFFEWSRDVVQSCLCSIIAIWNNLPRFFFWQFEDLLELLKIRSKIRSKHVSCMTEETLCPPILLLIHSVSLNIFIHTIGDSPSNVIDETVPKQM